MGFFNIPAAPGTDISDYRFTSQFKRALQERAHLIGSLTHPRANFVWSTGTVTGITDNGDGSYTVTHAGDGTAANRWAGYSGHGTIPVDYDLILDDKYDETQVVHVRIYASTATTFKIDSGADHLLLDLVTSCLIPSGLAPVANVAALLTWLNGRTYYVIRRGGEWWHERWAQYPNDPESWKGGGLVAGAFLPVSLTSGGGTTAVAVHAAHQYLTGDTVTISGAVSGGGHYNGTFTIVVVSPDTFTYTMAAPDDPAATGSPVALNVNVGAHDPTTSNAYPSIATAYPPAKYASGHVLMVRGSSGLLRRIPLIDNDTANLLFTRLSPDETVSGTYAVMPAIASATGRPSRYREYSLINALCTYNAMAAEANKPARPSQWYHSLWTNYHSRFPDGSVGGAKLPASAVTLLDGTGTPYVAPVFDVDLWTEFDDPFNPADKNYTPDYYRTHRSDQKTAEDMSGFFVAPVNYEAAAAIPNFCRATWFYYCGINADAGTTGALNGTGGVGGIDVSGIDINGTGLPYAPIDVFYAVLNADGTIHSEGAGSMDTNTHLNKDAGSFGAGDVGKTVVISLGWTRYVPRQFLYMFAKTAWIPDYDGAHAAYVDPPTAAFPGHWQRRAASTKYKKTDAAGFVDDANGDTPFIPGILARHVGDNFNDPNVRPVVAVGDPAGLVGYYNALYDGGIPAAARAARDALRRGTASDGTAFYLEDTSKNWWPGGVLHTESGTADGGSTTDLSDSTKAGSNLWAVGVFGFSGFVVEVSIGGTWYPRRMPSPATGTQLVWLQPLPSTAAGNAYRVRWPKYEANTFEGRTLRVTLPGGASHDLVIRSNDDVRLYFDTQAFAIDPGTAYEILEPAVGGVYNWNGSAWTAPAGADPRVPAVMLHDNPAENLPDYRVDYGRVHKDDYFNYGLYNELAAAIKALVWIKAPYNWTAAGETNRREGNAAGALVLANGSTGARDVATAAFLASALTDDNSPYAVSWTDYNCSCYGYAVGRRYAYGQLNLSVPATNKATEIDFYVYAKVADDTAGGGGAGRDPVIGCPAQYLFDANGDGVLLDAWHKFATEGPATTTNRQTTSALGVATNAPALPTNIGPAPTDCVTLPQPGYCQWYQGYTIPQWTAIVRGDVAGGLAYV